MTLGPPLFHATCLALETFQRQFAPKDFPMLYAPDHQRDKFIREWADALKEITHEAIPDAARRWIADPAKLKPSGRVSVPNAASFKQYAKAVDLKYYRVHHPRTAKPSHNEKDQAQHLSARALSVLKDRSLVSEVWGLLLSSCVNDDERAKVRRGYVSMSEFDAAVEIVRDSARVSA
jgi:hypothetical protein